MTTAKTIRSTRVAAEISATLLASKAQINRSRYSGIECGHVQATEDELLRLAKALEELLHARAVVQQTAAEMGWPGRIA
jgi:transcriptional regulator with XRE-family HTH domain